MKLVPKVPIDLGHSIEVTTCAEEMFHLNVFLVHFNSRVIVIS